MARSSKRTPPAAAKPDPADASPGNSPAETPAVGARALLARIAKANPRHAAFCYALVADPARNATAAYQDAFGCTRDSACTRAPKLMQRPEVAAAIAALDEERLARLAAAAPALEANADRTLLEIGRLAFADIRQVAEWDADGVRFLASAKLSDDAAAAIASVEQVPTPHGIRIRVKLHEKPAALRMLGDHLPGFWAPKELKVDDGLSRDEAIDRVLELLGEAKRRRAAVLAAAESGA